MKDELFELLSTMTDVQLGAVIDKLPDGQREHLIQIADEYGNALRRERGQKHFMEFVKTMWPSFIGGRHHQIMANAFERVARGELKRLIINMPPRHTKSEFASYLLPAWYLGKFPQKKIIQSSNTGELAVGFGRKVRNLVDSESYSKVFPNVALRHDSKAAGRWSTNENGEYFAIGVGGTLTGKGADKDFTIYSPEPDTAPILIPDTREGWVESVSLLINAYLIADKKNPIFDYSVIRPAGVPIKTLATLCSCG